MHRTLLIYWAWVLRSCNRFTFIQSHYIFLLFTAFKWNTELWHRKLQNEHRQSHKSIHLHVAGCHTLQTGRLVNETAVKSSRNLERRRWRVEGRCNRCIGRHFTLQGRVREKRDCWKLFKKKIKRLCFLKIGLNANKTVLCLNRSSGNITLKNLQTKLSVNMQFNPHEAMKIIRRK